MIENPGSAPAPAAGGRKPSIALNIVLAAAFVGAIVALSVIFGPAMIDFVKDPKRLREFLLSKGPLSALIFIGLQFLQVVIAIIPGEPIQIAGGYVFGAVLGTVYSFAGITLGYFAVFFAVRLAGFGLVKKAVPEKELNKFYSLMNSPGSEVTIFLLFLIPGIPKDVLVYIAGLTPVKPLLFFIIISVARLPAMIGSSLIGSSLEKGNYTAVIVLSVVAFVLFILGLVFKDKIVALFHKKAPVSSYPGKEGEKNEKTETRG